MKLWYAGPMFRYEQPQSGRQRQFTQVGAEALGSDDPAVDAETILLLATLLVGFGMFGSFILIPQLAEAPESTGYGFGLSATGAGAGGGGGAE